MIITSPQNEKLKLVRRLGRRRAREREGLFVGEGEDLLAAAGAAGEEPVELLTAAGEGLGGTEVEPALLARVSTLGSGTRAIGVWPQRWADQPIAPCTYLHAVSDPGNVGAVIRTAHALTLARVRSDTVQKRVRQPVPMLPTPAGVRRQVQIWRGGWVDRRSVYLVAGRPSSLVG